MWLDAKAEIVDKWVSLQGFNSKDAVVGNVGLGDRGLFSRGRGLAIDGLEAPLAFEGADGFVSQFDAAFIGVAFPGGAGFPAFQFDVLVVGVPKLDFELLCILERVINAAAKIIFGLPEVDADIGFAGNADGWNAVVVFQVVDRDPGVSWVAHPGETRRAALGSRIGVGYIAVGILQIGRLGYGRVVHPCRLFIYRLTTDDFIAAVPVKTIQMVGHLGFAALKLQ